ncbi:MAG: transcription antitermination protein NusB [Mycoplasmataceae bacterium RC_NB112A]|nr:MAG: transcription antitermination protein NusB [Mycoplasmataceae bacterium RC_NB112A]
MTVRLDKKKIVLLYQYYLLGKINPEGAEEKLIEWFKQCLAQENFLRPRIAAKLKKDWEFSRLSPLEKAILIYGAYELLVETRTKLFLSNLIINNLINFSKAYLEKEKVGYINKVLDLLSQEKKSNK